MKILNLQGCKTNQFNIDHLLESSTRKVLTSDERTKISYLNSQYFSLQSDWEKTVGSGKDYESIASAVSALERKFVAYPKLTLDAGTYTEKILDGSEKLLCRQLELVGDTRNIVGTRYIDGFTIRTNDSTNGGVGTISLGNSGNDITIQASTTNPDLVAAGLVSGGKILVVDNSNAVAEHTIDSVSGYTITLTDTAPTVGNTGSSVTILPNRKLTHSSTLLSGDFSCKIKLTGFYIYLDAEQYIFSINYNQEVEINNCVFNHNGNNYDSVFLARNSVLQSSNSTCSNVCFTNSKLYAIFSECAHVRLVGLSNAKTKGLYLKDGSSATLPNYTCTANGLQSVNYAIVSSSMYADRMQCYGYYRGLYSFIGSAIWSDNAYIASCNVGIYANVESTNYCGAVTWASNSANASPATSGTAGNNNSVNIYS